MAIAKKPIRSTNDIIPQQINSEKAAEVFIAGADKKQDKIKIERENKVPVMIRFDTQLLNQVDEVARRRGVSRSSWIQYTLSRALEHGQG